MGRKTFTPEQIIFKLREVEVQELPERHNRRRNQPSPGRCRLQFPQMDAGAGRFIVFCPRFPVDWYPLVLRTSLTTG